MATLSSQATAINQPDNQQTPQQNNDHQSAFDVDIGRYPALAADFDSSQLAAQIEPFDSFWEGPADIEKGYGKFFAFYKENYLPHIPDNRDANILVVSCGPGYFVNLLKTQGYQNVLGIDSGADKISWAEKRDLHCVQARAFEFLRDKHHEFDVIFCEQEINHLTKEEIPAFLALARNALKPGGSLMMHALNGANPITGAEALAQNYDHYNTFTEYTMKQVLEHYGFENTKVFGLNLYVFWKNPANYVVFAVATAFTWFFRGCFIMYGKSNKIFTKKIGGVCRKPLT